MKVKDRARYTNNGRCIALREPCSVPWARFPDEYACQAQPYLTPNSNLDRDQRIEAAIRAFARSTPPPRALIHPKYSNAGRGVSIAPRPSTVHLARPKGLAPQGVKRERIGRNHARPNATVRQHNLQKQLESCANRDEKEFFRNRLSQGQSTTQMGLTFCVGGRTRWCVDLCKKWARVIQKGRFAGDDEFWRLRLSAAREFVRTKRAGKHLIFRLVSGADFRSFQNIADNELAAFLWHSSD